MEEVALISGMFTGMLGLAVCGWAVAVGVGVLRLRSWARTGGLWTFILFTLVTAIPASTSDGLVGWVVPAANAAVVVMLLLPATRRAFWHARMESLRPDLYPADGEG